MPPCRDTEQESQLELFWALPCSTLTANSENADFRNLRNKTNHSSTNLQLWNWDIWLYSSLDVQFNKNPTKHGSTFLDFGWEEGANCWIVLHQLKSTTSRRNRYYYSISKFNLLFSPWIFKCFKSVLVDLTWHVRQW